MKVDEIDRKILSLYCEDSRISQDEIAKALNVSQPSVAARIKALREEGILHTKIGINPFKLRMSLAKVDIKTANSNKLLKLFRGCPYFVNGFSVSGDYNLCLFLMSESISTLESIVNSHVKKDDDVQDAKFNIVISSEKTMLACAPLHFTKGEKPPCGAKCDCKKCDSFEDEKCMGCPAIDHYQGSLY